MSEMGAGVTKGVWTIFLGILATSFGSRPTFFASIICVAVCDGLFCAPLLLAEFKCLHTDRIHRSHRRDNATSGVKSKISKYYHHSRHNLQWDNILLLLLWYNVEYVKCNKNLSTGDTCWMGINEYNMYAQIVIIILIRYNCDCQFNIVIINIYRFQIKCLNK